MLFLFQRNEDNHMGELDKRFWEIDLLRGIAVVMMIIFHFLFDLTWFGGYGIDVYTGFWWFFARATAMIFLVLVGVSLTLSRSRAAQKAKAGFRKYLKRGTKIFIWGLLITAVTYVFLPGAFIFFGVLHLIGVSVILAYPLMRHCYRNLALGLIIIAAGLYLATLRFDSWWLAWLGFMPEGLYTLDYFPILPWFGLVLTGLFMGNILYKSYKRGFSLPDLSGSITARPFCFLGRHSLLIYLIHQPILIIVLYLLGLVDVGMFLP